VARKKDRRSPPPPKPPTRRPTAEDHLARPGFPPSPDDPRVATPGFSAEYRCRLQLPEYLRPENIQRLLQAQPQQDQQVHLSETTDAQPNKPRHPAYDGCRAAYVAAINASEGKPRAINAALAWAAAEHKRGALKWSAPDIRTVRRWVSKYHWPRTREL
jgi:hypothetical protein